MLKKLALIVAIIFMFNLIPEKTLLFEIDGDYTFYLNSASSNAEIITVEYESAKKLKSSLNNVCGESVKTDDYKKIESELKRFNAVFLFCEKVDDMLINYYYSDKILTYKTINGYKVNLQTAKREQCYSIGSPLIFGSF